MAITLKLTKADAKTIGLTLAAVVAVADKDGLGNRFTRLAGWSGTAEAEYIYIGTLIRLSGYIETIAKAGR